MAQQGYYEHEMVTPVAGTSSDIPPPPPAHRVPLAVQQQQQRLHHDPNDYSDYSTPGQTPNSDSRSAISAGAHDRDTAHDTFDYTQPVPPKAMYSQRSYASNAPLSSAAALPAGVYANHRSMPSYPAPQGVPYTDSPYNRYSSSAQNLAPQMGLINPNEVADDDDWGMGPSAAVQSKRRSFVPFGASRDDSRNTSRNGSPGSSIAKGVAGVGVGAGAAYSASSHDDGSGKYNAVPIANGSQPELLQEKSDWMREDYKARKKNMWIAITIIAVVMLGAVLGGVLGSQLSKGGGGNHKDPSSVSDQDIAADNKDDLSINSAEIKSLMGNSNLHKVFPGMDYTPLNAQYPDCLHAGPSQNNITRDMAVMSQLTNSVRLYGTDCNQTQMVIHAIDRLEIKDTMKIWLGVWLDNNDTTTNRQIEQTWTLLDNYGCDYFNGIIVGNEVLYRKDMSSTELLGHVTDFRTNITAHKCQLPVAMADLGDNWTADMATKVDIVMSNVHPFFSGTQVKDAAAWTWDFWQKNDVALTASNLKIKQVIAEVGWPSGGGTDCGGAASCTLGSVAGVEELNQFMEDWVCPSLKNETLYFWFSAFDEPWKVVYNEKGKEWEDKWGLMDISRNLKPGLTIPDCGGAALPTFN